MFDHRYLAEMSKALHIFLGFSFLACGVMALIRVSVTRTVPAAAKAPGGQHQSGPQAAEGYVYCTRR
jgi:hypothetical protein